MQLSSIEMHCRSCLFSLAVVGSVLGALPCGAETISSHDQRDKPESTTIRSNPNGTPKKVVRPPPPPPETLIVVPVTPTNQQSQNPQR